MTAKGYQDPEGHIVVFEGTLCSQAYCRQEGCVFPNCARRIALYPSLVSANESHPDLEIIEVYDEQTT